MKEKIYSSAKETYLGNDSEYYKIELWKSDNMERKVLKHWND